MTKASILIEFCAAGMILSFLLFIFGSAQGVQAVLFAFVVVFNINIIFIFCYFGNQLTDEGFLLNETIYFTNWYNWQKKSKILFQLLLMYSQRPLYMMIGNLSPVTLQTFKSIVNTSYTYFTMLQRIRE